MSKEAMPFGRKRHVLEPADFAAVYAMGDIHGCLDALIAAERKIVKDSADYPGRKLIVTLGDYVDRGPQSRQVIDHLLEPPPCGFERISLCGNHEDAFLGYLSNPSGETNWVERWGRETLLSYDIDPADLLQAKPGDGGEAVLRSKVPQSHRDFLADLAVAVTLGRVILVHAGLQPGLPMDAQIDRDLYWMREPFVTVGPQMPVMVVHGHTPAPEPVWGEGRLCIDTAVVRTGRTGVARIVDGVVAVI